MRRILLFFTCLTITILFLGFFLETINASAKPIFQIDKTIPTGAALYDNWFAYLGQNPPSGDHPIWSNQTTNTRSGSDTWRCVTCHGWDYLGKDGAYGRGSNYTGFPNIYEAVEKLDEQSIVQILSGANDPDHDFSVYLEEQDLADLANFLKNGLILDSEFIDPVTFKVLGGDLEQGKQSYDEVCASCHGMDGTSISFRFEGQDASLGTLAVLDPWRYLHKTRFGTPGTEMPVGYSLGWTPAQGRDVLLFSQSMPTGLGPADNELTMADETGTEAELVGGPAQNTFTGILTALGTMATWLGFVIIIGAVLIAIILLIVWVLRGQSNK